MCVHVYCLVPHLTESSLKKQDSYIMWSVRQLIVVTNTLGCSIGINNMLINYFHLQSVEHPARYRKQVHVEVEKKAEGNMILCFVFDI